MNPRPFLYILILSSFACSLLGQQEDFFKKYAGPVPAKVHYISGINAKEMILLGVWTQPRASFTVP